MPIDAGPEREGGAVEQSYAAALERERKRRQELEKHLHDLSEENRRNRREAEERDRLERIREGLRENGVVKADLAMRILRDDVRRGEDGELYGEVDGTPAPLDAYLSRFLAENPEFLPPRISGGTGIPASERANIGAAPFQMDDIRPGMSTEEAKRAWKEVARLMGQREQPLG